MGDFTRSQWTDSPLTLIRELPRHGPSNLLGGLWLGDVRFARWQTRTRWAGGSRDLAPGCGALQPRLRS